MTDRNIQYDRYSQLLNPDLLSKILYFTRIVCNFTKKEFPTQFLSCKFSEIFRNPCFQKHLQTTVLTKVRSQLKRPKTI